MSLLKCLEMETHQSSAVKKISPNDESNIAQKRYVENLKPNISGPEYT